MKLRMNKKVAVVMAVVILSLALATTAFAADNYKNLKAWFGEIKIFNNGTQVQLKDKPFIVDGTTYLPVRSVSEMLGKDITWDGKNYHIGINDKPGTNYNELLNKYIIQEVKVGQLEAKVKELEAKLKVKEEEKVSTLSDMETKLNKDYGTSDKIDFDITLYGNKDKIEVRVYIDDRSSSDRWSGWRTSDNKSYLQDITDDILKEFKNAKVSGFIEDTYPTKSIKTSFTVSTKGVVSVGSTSGGSGSGSGYYDDLEYDLEYEYVSTSNGITRIRAYQSSTYVDLTIDADGSEWDYGYVSGSAEKTLEDMAWYIVKNYYYDYSEIYGEVVDYDGNSYTFDFNSSGYVRIYK